jgi:protein-tyrosine phosphatase
MAEMVLRAELARAGLAGRAEVESAGTGDWHIGGPIDPGASAELAARGYDGSAHRARQFRASWFARFDLIAAMDRHNLRDLRAAAPDAENAGRVRMFRSFDPAPNGHVGDLDVPDPYHGTARDYARAFDLVEPAARGLAAQLAELLAARPG